MTEQPKTPQQGAYTKKKEKLTALRKAANEGATEKVKEWHKQNPGNEDLAVKPLNAAFVRNPPGFTKAILRIADVMVFDKTGKKKQNEIVREIQPQFPDFELRPTIWQKKLHPAVVEKVAARIQGNMASPIDLHGCKTLSGFRKRLKAHNRVAMAVHTFKGKISISKEAVVVAGAKEYPVEKRGSGGRTYPAIRVTVKNKRQWIRLDALAFLLFVK
ncbi:MAG: hypothetical protein K8R48_01315 [Alphaproteobacteria bacterium]|nr:hypothetical protein [Alphaproteobacteria bacterium]